MLFNYYKYAILRIINVFFCIALELSVIVKYKSKWFIYLTSFIYRDYTLFIQHSYELRVIKELSFETPSTSLFSFKVLDGKRVATHLFLFKCILRAHICFILLNFSQIKYLNKITITLPDVLCVKLTTPKNYCLSRCFLSSIYSQCCHFWEK